MKTVTETLVLNRDNGKGSIVFICNKIYIILPINFRGYLSLRGNGNLAIEVDRDAQFKAYVNNRLNILLMWVQCVKIRDLQLAKQHLQFFLHDMEHHFVDTYVGTDIRNAYRWIKAYVKAYPVTPKKDRTEKAYRMIARIYESLGMELPFKKGLHCFPQGR